MVMSSVWLYSLGSVILVSLISLVGLFTIGMNIKKLKNVLLFLVSFSTGALLGDAFIHLLPEAVESFGFGLEVSLYVLLGVLLFFILEKIIHWRHCHHPTSKDHPHPFAIMNLIGDGFHNLIDGMIIGGAYLISVPVGFATTLAVVLHEIPQEIGDFGVLIHGGFSKNKALFYNFISALGALVGVVVSLVIGMSFENYSLVLLPLTAGGFIYIAGSDLIPELHKEVKISRSLLQIVGMVLGVLVMLALTLI